MIKIGKLKRTWASSFLYRELTSQLVLMVLLEENFILFRYKFIYWSLMIKATLVFQTTRFYKFNPNTRDENSFNYNEVCGRHALSSGPLKHTHTHTHFITFHKSSSGWVLWTRSGRHKVQHLLLATLKSWMLKSDVLSYITLSAPQASTSCLLTRYRKRNNVLITICNY